MIYHNINIKDATNHCLGFPSATQTFPFELFLAFMLQNSFQICTEDVIQLGVQILLSRRYHDRLLIQLQYGRLTASSLCDCNTSET